MSTSLLIGCYCYERAECVSLTKQTPLPLGSNRHCLVIAMNEGVCICLYIEQGVFFIFIWLPWLVTSHSVQMLNSWSYSVLLQLITWLRPGIHQTTWSIFNHPSCLESNVGLFAITWFVNLGTSWPIKSSNAVHCVSTLCLFIKTSLSNKIAVMINHNKALTLQVR
jgi:hypothetical protein